MQKGSSKIIILGREEYQQLNSDADESNENS